MIKRYSDHAANERTFLAWVRTAIAVMAFGFLIERFDLFVRVAAPPLAARQLGAHGDTIAIAWLRFSRTASDIDRQDEVASPGERFDLALAVMIGLLGLSLALYLSRAVLPTL